MNFKKLISNLPFNPSLISQVSFYAKRLHKEEKIRRLGVVMIVLSLFLQMFAVISPPEPTLAESDNDIIRGGFNTKEEAVQLCRNNAEFRGILQHYGVSCDLLQEKGKKERVRSIDNGRSLDSMGRLPQGPRIERTGKHTNEYKVSINGRTYYMRNLWAWDSGEYSTYDMLVVSSAKVAIMYNCGNIVIDDSHDYTPPEKPKPTPPKVVGNATCTSLVATPLSERKFRFRATTSGKDYSVKSYTFTFGDGQSRTVTTSNKSTSVTHTYGDEGNYTTNAQVKVELKDGSSTTAKTLQCQASVTATTPDECPLVVGTQTDKSECDVCPDIPGEQSNPAECKPCDESQSDQDAEACLVLTKTAKNNTQKIDNADNTTAQAGDRITYTLLTKNTGKATVKGYVIEESVSDILDYAEITNTGGGKLDDDNVVRWAATDISPGETITKRLNIEVKDPVPQTPISASDPARFDLVMNNVYGNAVNIRLPETIVKTTETVNRSLPETGPGTTVTMSVMITMIVSYFFARSRLLAKEMDMVRSEYATSGSY